MSRSSSRPAGSGTRARTSLLSTAAAARLGVPCWSPRAAGRPERREHPACSHVRALGRLERRLRSLSISRAAPIFVSAGALRAVRPCGAGSRAGRLRPGAVRHPDLSRAVGRRGGLRPPATTMRRSRQRSSDLLDDPATAPSARGRRPRALAPQYSAERDDRRHARHLLRDPAPRPPRSPRGAPHEGRPISPTRWPRAGITATRISCAACCASWSRAAIAVAAYEPREARGACRTSWPITATRDSARIRATPIRSSRPRPIDDGDRS